MNVREGVRREEGCEGGSEKVRRGGCEGEGEGEEG